MDKTILNNKTGLNLLQARAEILAQVEKENLGCKAVFIADEKNTIGVYKSDKRTKSGLGKLVKFL